MNNGITGERTPDNSDKIVKLLERLIEISELNNHLMYLALGGKENVYELWTTKKSLDNLK